MVDIRTRKLISWDNVKINTRKLNSITHILRSSQVIASFSQIPFPRHRESMHTFQKFLAQIYFTY